MKKGSSEEGAMTIKRVRVRNRPFTILDNDLLQDDKLSWKARGILAYALSRGDEWDLRIRELTGASPDGVDSLRTGLKELKEHYYADLIPLRDQAGIIRGKGWVVYEIPDLNPKYQDALRAAKQVPMTFDAPVDEDQLITLKELLKLWGLSRLTARIDIAWRKLEQHHIQEITKVAAKYIAATQDKRYRLSLHNYLDVVKRPWEDEIINRNERKRVGFPRYSKTGHNRADQGQDGPKDID